MGGVEEFKRIFQPEPRAKDPHVHQIELWRGQRPILLQALNQGRGGGLQSQRPETTILLQVVQDATQLESWDQLEPLPEEQASKVEGAAYQRHLELLWQPV